MRQRNSREDARRLQEDGMLHTGGQAMQDGVPGPRLFVDGRIEVGQAETRTRSGQRYW
jgi:hypothetical protein